MTYHGKVSRGVVVFDGEPPPEGTAVEVLTTDATLRDLRDSGFVEHTVAALDIPAHLDEMRNLKDGWLEGKGKSPPLEGLDWLSRAFKKQYPEDLVPPHLYPTAEGGVQAEWTLKPFDISLEIDLKTRKSQWHSLHLQTGKEGTANLDLNDDKSWIWVADQLKRKSAGAA